jgi:hypothetical protein
MKGPVNRRTWSSETGRTDEGASEQTDVVKLDFKVLCCSVFVKTVKLYVGILTVATVRHVITKTTLS